MTTMSFTLKVKSLIISSPIIIQLGMNLGSRVDEVEAFFFYRRSNCKSSMAQLDK